MPYPTKKLGFLFRNAPISHNTPFNKIQQNSKQVTTTKRDVTHKKNIFGKNWTKVAMFQRFVFELPNLDHRFYHFSQC
jgi:hypothetical protein